MICYYKLFGSTNFLLVIFIEGKEVINLFIDFVMVSQDTGVVF